MSIAAAALLTLYQPWLALVAVIASAVSFYLFRIRKS